MALDFYFVIVHRLINLPVLWVLRCIMARVLFVGCDLHVEPLYRGVRRPAYCWAKDWHNGNDVVVLTYRHHYTNNLSLPCSRSMKHHVSCIVWECCAQRTRMTRVGDTGHDHCSGLLIVSSFRACSHLIKNTKNKP